MPTPLSFTLTMICPLSGQEDGFHGYFGFVIRNAAGCFLLLIYRVKSIVKQIEQYPPHVLLHYLYFRQIRGQIEWQSSELNNLSLILGRGTRAANIHQPSH